MDIPTYVQSPDQENYNEELSQTLIDGLSNNGWTVPQITTADLTVTPFIAPNGATTTVAAYMPDGTLWFCTDHVPPVYVGKISGALVKFTTAAFP